MFKADPRWRLSRIADNLRRGLDTPLRHILVYSERTPEATPYGVEIDERVDRFWQCDPPLRCLVRGCELSSDPVRWHHHLYGRRTEAWLAFRDAAERAALALMQTWPHPEAIGLPAYPTARIDAPFWLVRCAYELAWSGSMPFLAPVMLEREPDMPMIVDRRSCPPEAPPDWYHSGLSEDVRLCVADMLDALAACA